MSAREGTLRLSGSEDAVTALAPRVAAALAELRRGAELTSGELQGFLCGDPPELRDGRLLAAPRRAARGAGRGLPAARTPTQQVYLDAVGREDLVLATGPAGTGKTFLAVAAAVRALQAGQVQRIVLTRPAVEAGERLGFLPGDFEAKVNPYLRPLHDALRDILGTSGVRRLRSLDLVEIAPLAFMRGRTLARSFIILDEAQNCTPGQMKMFLTRLGEGSRTVVTGDLTQSDLVEDRGGLEDAIRRLRGVAGVAVVELTAVDIQRSAIVQRIVMAYEQP